MYQWKHNYGSNMGMLANHLAQMKAEFEAANVTIEKETKEKAEEENNEEIEETEEKPKRITKKQKNKNVADGIQERRSELETEFLANEDEIARLNKQIDKLQKRNTKIEENIKALMAALEVFKEEVT